MAAINKWRGAATSATASLILNCGDCMSTRRIAARTSEGFAPSKEFAVHFIESQDGRRKELLKTDIAKDGMRSRSLCSEPNV